MISAVFFDVANTLLNKPDLYTKITEALKDFKIKVNRDNLMQRHRLLSEVIKFPDKTSEEFYNNFNAELLMSLGITPDEKIIHHIFKSCTYLPWQPFEDTDYIPSIKQPKGILSNWDNSLKDKLSLFFQTDFKWVLGSQSEGIRKPDPEFFKLMIKNSGCAAGEILYIGDSIKLDIFPALKLGIKAVLVDRLDLYPDSNLERIKSFYELEKYL